MSKTGNPRHGGPAAPRSGRTTTGGQEVLLHFGAQAGVVLSGLAIQSLLAYALLPEGRGAYAACLALVSLFSVLFTPGADRGAQYFVMAKQISVSQGVAIATVICLAGAGLGAALALPLIHGDIAFFRKADAGSFQLALLLIPVTAFSMALQLQLAGLRRFAPLALFTLVQSGVHVVAVLVLVRGLDLGVTGAILSNALCCVVFIGICLLDLRRNCGWRPESPALSDLRKVADYSRRGHVSRVGSMLEQGVGVFFLGTVATQAEVGLFAVGLALMTRFHLIPYSVVPSVAPRVVNDAEDGAGLVALSTRVTYWTTGVALMGLLAISTPFVQALLSEAFLPIVPLLWIMAPGTFALCGALVLMAYFQSVNRPGVCSWATATGFGIHIASLVILYPFLGLEAAAWAVTIAFISRSAFLVFMYRRTTRRPLRSLWLPQRGDAERLRDLARRVRWGPPERDVREESVP
ncbi:MAG: polysaccharide biosynthesis C-terminal domain-containing protein [Rhodospirillales bacterium]|nr:polysaccharide biosynthesis C-terminal domain-containing protein [Rhodospirillales bacterium]